MAQQRNTRRRWQAGTTKRKTSARSKRAADERERIMREVIQRRRKAYEELAKH